MWRSHLLPFFLGPPLFVAGYLIGDNAVGVFLMGFGGLIILDAAGWNTAASSAAHFYPAADWAEVWREAYNPRSSAFLWSLLAITALAITTLRFGGAPEELLLLIMVPIGAYVVAAVLMFRADVSRYARTAGLQPRSRPETSEASVDATGDKDP